MAFFDKLGETIASVSKDVTQTAKEISGVAKLNIDIKAKEDYIQKQYAEIGKQYFDMHKDDETVMCPQFELIKEAMCSMEEMKKELMELKGLRSCPNCEAEVKNTDAFCSNCGAKLDLDEDIVVDAEEVDAESVEEAEVETEVEAEAKEAAEE